MPVLDVLTCSSASLVIQAVLLFAYTITTAILVFDSGWADALAIRSFPTDEGTTPREMGDDTWVVSAKPSHRRSIQNPEENYNNPTFHVFAQPPKPPNEAAATMVIAISA
jgi:hypothetical protein